MTSTPELPLVEEMRRRLEASVGPCPASAAPRAGYRPQVQGKFLTAGDEKLYVRGVTYGPFRANEHGSEYHDPGVVARDLALMAANGVNAIRTYSVPPRWLLDAAQHRGVWVVVGLPWEE